MEGNPEYSRKTSFAFAKTAWFCFTFLGSKGAWHSGPPRYASGYRIEINIDEF